MNTFISLRCTSSITRQKDECESCSFHLNNAFRLETTKVDDIMHSKYRIFNLLALTFKIFES